MKSGCLWFDNSGERTLDEKVIRAAQYYTTKYGDPPDICYVHPTMLLAESYKEKLSCRMEFTPQNTIVLKLWEPDDVLDDNMEEWIIAIKTTNSIMPNHFWIGINKKEAA